jgi:hypothetical protein
MDVDTTSAEAVDDAMSPTTLLTAIEASRAGNLPDGYSHGERLALNCFCARCADIHKIGVDHNLAVRRFGFVVEIEYARCILCRGRGRSPMRRDWRQTFKRESPSSNNAIRSGTNAEGHAELSRTDHVEPTLQSHQRLAALGVWLLHY